LLVAARQDRFGEHRGLGISNINFKVTSQDNTGILIIENTFREKGGPARHLHYNQDEWFYITESEFLFEVGGETFQLHPAIPCWRLVESLMFGHTQVMEGAAF
jgi:mannose-6-phosphate isomerase-like protein (cupin superfamily)